MEFDHLGVIVKNLSLARRRMATLLPVRDWSTAIEDPVNGVAVQFGRDSSDFCFELVQPLGPNSPVAAALAGRYAILNHIAYRVGDLAAEANRLRAGGCARIGEPRPAVAYGGRLIQFFATPLNFIVELIEAPDHRHRFVSLPIDDAGHGGSDK